MLAYEIRKNYIEVNDKNEIYEGCTTDQPQQDPEKVETFDEKEEAIEKLKKYSSELREMPGYVLYSEYYVEECEYDEDGEWVGGGDIVKFTNLPAEI